MHIYLVLFAVAFDHISNNNNNNNEGEHLKQTENQK